MWGIIPHIIYSLAGVVVDFGVVVVLVLSAFVVSVDVAFSVGAVLLLDVLVNALLEPLLSFT